MAGNTVSLEFAGDATKLQQAAKKADAALTEVGDSAKKTGQDAGDGAAGTSRLTDRLGSLGAATSGATDAIDTLGGGLQAVADIQDFARQRAQRLEQAQADVEQAMTDTRQAAIDLEQAQRDLTQSSLDLGQAELDQTQADQDREQAILDVKKAQDEYNKAVKEHGAKSDEARQAALDLSQAEQDKSQALLDSKQATADYNQALTDQKQATEDGKQANIDARQAQIDLNDALHEANPSAMQDVADVIGVVTPLLSAVVGVMGLVTAAQWLWNSALLASPITWIVLGIAAIIAIIVVIATKTTWFQDLWRVTWGGIKAAASAVGSWFSDTLWPKIRGAWEAITGAGKKAYEWMKALPGRVASAFSGIGEAIARPFRSAFNAVARAWNSTVGSLSWTVPDWIPGIGGNHISAPRLSTFHSGGRVPGMPGQEVPIMALAGEQVSAAGTGGQGEPIRVTVMMDSRVLVDAVADGVARRGGRGPNGVQFVLGGGRG
jgi:hypothetical protein